MTKNQIQVAGKIENSLSNGTGLRYVLFVSGCSHHCKGCQNPQTWNQEYGDTINIDDVLKDIKSNMPLIKGVTLSGGEPFEQVESLSILAKEIKALGLNIWCYTGYTLSELKAKHNMYVDKLLKCIDVLVDGLFVEDLKDSNLIYKGSSNQNIIQLEEGEKICYLKF